jgi:metal-responsive CopG/Arc/MetJ family transcriptional regulator
MFGRIEVMKTARKTKVSVTLEKALLAEIDRRAVGRGTRSQIIEEWLRLAAREHARRALDAATIAYYEGRTAEQRAEDETLAEFTTRASGELDFDLARRPRRRRA